MKGSPDFEPEVRTIHDAKPSIGFGVRLWYPPEIVALMLKAYEQGLNAGLTRGGL